jgi:hypothetical protein
VQAVGLVVRQDKEFERVLALDKERAAISGAPSEGLVRVVGSSPLRWGSNSGPSWPRGRSRDWLAPSQSARTPKSPPDEMGDFIAPTLQAVLMQYQPAVGQAALRLRAPADQSLGGREAALDYLTINDELSRVCGMAA